MEKKKVTKTVRNLLGISSLGSGYSFAFIAYMSAYVLTDVVKLPVAAVSTIMSVSSLLVSFISPFGGVLMDITRPGKIGSIRKFMIIFPTLWMIGLALGYINWSENAAVTTIILIIIWTIKSAGGNMGQNVVPAMAARISSTPNERSYYAGRMSMFLNTGMLLYSLTSVAVVAFFVKLVNGNERVGYPLFAFFTGVMYFAASMVEFKITKGYDPTEDMLEAQESGSGHKSGKAAKGASIKSIVKNIFTNSQIGVIALVCLGLNIANSLGNLLLIYYYNYVAENDVLYSMNLTLNTFLGIVLAFLITILCKRLSNKTMALCGVGMSIIGLVLCRLFGLSMPVLFMVGAVMVGAGLRATIYMAPALLGDCAVYSQWKTGVDTAASIMGVSSAVMILGGVFRSVLFGVCLSMSGYVAGEIPTAEVKNGLVNAYTVIPTVLAVVVFLIIFFFYKLDNKKLQQYQKEINDRSMAG